MVPAPSLARSARAAGLALPILLLGAVAIAFSPIFVKLSEAGPTATAFWRVALALPLLWAWMAAERRPRKAPPRRPAGRRDVLMLALAGLFFAGDLVSWHWSLNYTSVANSTLFANFSPLIVTLVGWLAFGERFSRTFLLGLACGLAGAAMLMGDSLRLGPATLAGDALALLTACFYGGYIIVVGRLRADFSAVTIMAWSGIVTAVAILPFALLSGERLVPVTLAGWALLVGLAWLSHAGGQTLIAQALAHLPPAFSAVTLLTQPVVAAALAWPLLGERIEWLQAAGGLVVLCGILLARAGSRGPRANAPRPAPPPAGPSGAADEGGLGLPRHL